MADERTEQQTETTGTPAGSALPKKASAQDGSASADASRDSSAQDKPRRGKRAHLADYVLNEEGAYEYAGTLWTWDVPGARDSFVRSSWMFFAGAALCLLAAGFIPAPAIQDAFFVLVPYALSFVALALSGISLWNITREGDELRDHVYSKHMEGLEVRLLFGVIASFAGAIGQVVNVLIRHTQSTFSTLDAAGSAAAGSAATGAATASATALPGEVLLMSLLFALCMAGAGACFIAIYRSYKALSFSPKK